MLAYTYCSKGSFQLLEKPRPRLLEDVYKRQIQGEEDQNQVRKLQ